MIFINIDTTHKALICIDIGKQYWESDTMYASINKGEHVISINIISGKTEVIL